MNWRRKFGAIAFVVLLVSSGCIGFVTGEEPLVYEANEVGVSEESKELTGYERTEREELTVNRTVSDREVRVSNWYARYEKYDDIAEETTGVFAAISTHRVDVFGRTTNPYASMRQEEILTNLTAQYDTSFGELDDVTFVENRTRTVLGKEATVGVFTTNTQFNGETVEIKLYVTRVRHGDDIIVALGGHPTKLPAGEEEILSLMEGLEHQTDEDASDSERVAAGGASEQLVDQPVAVATGTDTTSSAALTPPLAVRVAS
jgi:hypothetical protein